MGNARIQGQLWGARVQDWAAYVEQVRLPLFGAALDAARVSEGTRLLFAGCGARLLALLASFRGAQVAALEASPGLLAIARQRLPGADVREGDLEALPFADASFDAIGAVDSVFYAADIAAAMREFVRVAQRGGRVVITAWGPPEKCEFLRAVMPALAPLMPPPAPRRFTAAQGRCMNQERLRACSKRRACASWRRRARSPVPSSFRALRPHGAETPALGSTKRPLLIAGRPRFAPCMQMLTVPTRAPTGVSGMTMSFSGLPANDRSDGCSWVHAKHRQWTVRCAARS